MTLEMNKTKENNLGKQFVGSGFVKTCDEQVINPHFIFILLSGFSSLHYCHFFQFIQKLSSEENNFLIKTKNDYR